MLIACSENYIYLYHIKLDDNSKFIYYNEKITVD